MTFEAIPSDAAGRDTARHRPPPRTPRWRPPPRPSLDTLFLDAEAIVRLVRRTGLSACIAGIAARIEGDLQQMPPGFPVTEFWEVLAGHRPGRRRDDEVTVFDSLGFALEDAAAGGNASLMTIGD